MQPITAIAASISSSGTSARWLSSPNRFSSRAPVSPSAGSSGAWQITPRPISATIVGIVRITGIPGKTSRSRETGVPASTDATAFASPSSSSAVRSSASGFTASTTASDLSASSASESGASPPVSSASAAARPDPASQNSIPSGPCSACIQPRASAVAMFPAPANPILMP